MREVDDSHHNIVGGDGHVGLTLDGAGGSSPAGPGRGGAEAEEGALVSEDATLAGRSSGYSSGCNTRSCCCRS